jgi:WD40 repeat protein
LFFQKVHSVAWNCIGTKLASGSVDQTARIWHIEPHGHVSLLLIPPCLSGFCFSVCLLQ